MLENFHFIDPLWLLALIPLALLVWLVYRPGHGDNPWRRIVDARLLPLLMVGQARKASRAGLWPLAVGWLLATLALANPTWERKPLPVFQTTAARVIVLDLSRSMYASDLQPSRLVRARYKIEDVLAQSGEGQTGLVVYSGEAFTVTPLTRDVNTIRAMLPDVDPGIMPTTGSRPDLGLLRAGKLLNQAGATGGQVLLIADGVPAGDATATERAAAQLKSEGYQVSVLGVGTKAGAPLTNAQGELVRNASGNIVDVRLNTSTLKAVARAGGGEYRTISDNGRALRALLAQPMNAKITIKANGKTQGWKEQGPLLAVLLLPVAALAFRRNWLLGLLLLAGLAAPPRPAMASTWTDLWQRPDQQAAKALAAGDYAKAAALATSPARRGSAEYKRGKFKLALEDFSRATGADADYDRGNALAKLGRYRDAIAAYDKSLKENPADEDAKANKAVVEALLKKQKKEQQRSGSQGKQSRNGRSGGKQNSAQSKAGEQGPKQAKSAQNGGASGQGQQAASANQAGKGTHKGESSGANGKNSQNAASGMASGRPAAAQQPKSGNQFAAAAKRLAQQRKGMTKSNGKQASRATSGATSGGNAANQMRAAANAARRQSANADADNAQPLSRDEQLAAQEWLRRIPDDPGGLLRRKFLYEYRQRQLHRGSAD